MLNDKRTEIYSENDKKGEINPETYLWSATALDRLTKCPLSFYYYKIKGLRGESNILIDRGSAFHDGAELFWNNLKLLLPEHPLNQEVWETIAEIWYADRRYKHLIEIDLQYVTGVRNYIRRQQNRLNILLTEFPDKWQDLFFPLHNESELKSTKEKIHGRLDQSFLTPIGTLCIEDIKTSERMPTNLEGSRKTQLVMQGMLAIENGWTIDKIECISNYYPLVRPDAMKRSKLFYKDIKAVRVKIAKATELLKAYIEESYFPEDPSDSNCKYCNYKPLCREADII